MGNKESIILVVLHITGILLMDIISIVSILGITSTENNKMITTKKFNNVHIHAICEHKNDMMRDTIETTIHDMKNVLVPVQKTEMTMENKENITLRKVEFMKAKITTIHQTQDTIDRKKPLIYLHKKLSKLTHAIKIKETVPLKT